MPVHFLKKRGVDEDVWTLALRRMHGVYDRFDHVAVSFSGGKDSTATLQVALAVAEERDRLPLRVVFFDEEAIPTETADYVRRVGQDPRVTLEWYCMPIKHRNACSRKHPWWWPWAPEEEAKWVRPLPPEGITDLAGFPIWPPEARPSMPDAVGLLFPARLGETAMLLGIRADESLTRQRAVSRRRVDNYIVPWGQNNRGPWDGSHLWKVYPVYDWTANDVWTAPAKMGWDYNSAYDSLEMAGVPVRQQRCSPAYGEEPLQKLWTYAHAFPDIWDRMTDRVPGAATAARYATTELYSYGSRPEPPEGVSWQDFIVEYVAKHSDQESPQVAARIGEWIRWHYSATVDPILPTARHPVTGISWNGLLMIAMRGDFKDRKQFQPGADPDVRARLTEAYNTERAKLSAAERTA